MIKAQIEIETHVSGESIELTTVAEGVVALMNKNDVCHNAIHLNGQDIDNLIAWLSKIREEMEHTI